MEVEAIERLVRELSAARDAASRIGGRTPVGVRAVEPAAGRRWYLCAFDGPSFACLTSDLGLERDERRARQAAACALLVEHAEGLVVADELEVVAGVAGRLIALSDGRPDLTVALADLAEAARLMAAWVGAPERAVASLHGLERTVSLQDDAREAYRRFVDASEPLVPIQDRLPADQVGALRDLEEACGRAGLGERLSRAVGAAIEQIDEGAREMLLAYVGRLHPSG